MPEAALRVRAYDLVTQRLTEVTGYTPRGGKGDWRCPAHEDKTASLSVTQGDKGVILHCHAFCTTEDVVAALNLTMADLFDKDDQPKKREVESVYKYTDEQGNYLFESVRYTDKSFTQRVKQSTGGYVWKLDGVRRVLYRLPHVLEGIEYDQTIFIVEGEKDVHSVEGAGGVATCNPMGAGNWQPEYADCLKGATVIVVADKDTAGMKHGRDVYHSVKPVAKSTWLRGAAVGKDITDHLRAGKKLKELVPLPVDPAEDVPQDDGGLIDEDEEFPVDQHIDDFLNEEEPEYDWVIPDVLERMDRMVLTGEEGRGKSTMLRQMAVQAAAGIHPFTLEPMAPIRVYLLDLENAKKQVKRKIRPLRLAAGDALSPEQLRIRVKSEGLDLLQVLDEEWFEGRIKANQPDLVITGPLYKLASGDPTEEKVARHVTHILDRLRVKYGFALILEAHSPHAQGGKRPTRPYGASLWLRWPEFGLFLSPQGEIDHWRGARDERAWPRWLKRGGEWPWSPATDPQSVTFAAVMGAIRDANRVLSERELADKLGGAKTKIHRAIEANAQQWADICREYEDF